MKNETLDLAWSAERTPALADLRPSWTGILFYYLLPVRRRTILRNMNRVFGDRLSRAEIRRLAQCFYAHFARSIRENLSLIWMSEQRHTAQVDVVGVEHLLRAAERGKGLLILSGHFGNWEFAAIAAIRQFEQYRNRFHLIRKKLIVGLEWLITGRCRRAGLKVISTKDALTRVFDALANNDAIINIMDQHATWGPKSVRVEFFGEPANTNRSLALLAGNTGAPVIPASSHRKPDGRHVMEFHEPLEWISCEDNKREIELNTRRYNRVLERFVLEHPEQWFWMHRRWK